MLRPELTPPPRNRTCEELVEQAYLALDEGRSPEPELQRLEQVSGRQLSVEDLHGYFGSTDASELAELLNLPDDLRVDAITEEELVEIVRRLMPTEESYDPNHERYWTALFEANVPWPQAASLIYYPPERSASPESWDPTAKEVVQLALSYRPIQL